MLETPQERVKLLKDGLSGKRIEELYIKYNNFKIVNSPVTCEKVEICDCEIVSSISGSTTKTCFYNISNE